MNSGLAIILMIFTCGGANWTLDQDNSVKIRENTENVCPDSFTSYYHVLIYFPFPGQLINIKLGAT